MDSSRKALVQHAPLEETFETKMGRGAIFAVHHASLVLAFKGKHIFIDPAPLNVKNDSKLAFTSLPKPDLIIYTHCHADHYDTPILEAIIGPETRIIAPAEVASLIPESLRSRVLVMANGGTASKLGVDIEAVPMYNSSEDRTTYHPKGKGNGYILTIGDTRVYIAGDTDETPEIAYLPDIDIAFVPLNISHGASLDAMVQWVKKLKPRVVYPYHIRHANGTLADLEAFATGVGSASLVKLLRWY